MQQVRFGNTGIGVSLMCLGTMMFGGRCDEREADSIIGAAIDGGVNFIDTAAMYEDGRTEEILGRILKGRREQLFVTTKVHKGVDGPSIRGSLEESLRRLQTDRVDLYMIHWPVKGMRPEEMMAALNDVVAAGKTRFIGFCNCPAWVFAYCNSIARSNGWPELVCNQVPYNLLERGIEVEILPQARTIGIAITTYRALSAGLLAGKYRPGQPLPPDARGATDVRLATWLGRYGEGVAQLLAMADELDVEPGHLATAWVYGQDGVTSPIVGVSSLKQLLTALAGFSLVLTNEQRERLAGFFDTAVKEEAGGRFPEFRREIALVDA